MTKVSKMDQNEQFIELRAKEMSYEQISNELKVSKPTLLKWSRELEVEITNRRALEMEFLQDKYVVSKKKRVELFGAQLDRLKEELAKPDLSEIATEKLFELQMKTVASLKQEETVISLKERVSVENSLEMLTDTFVEWKA